MIKKTVLLVCILFCMFKVNANNLSISNVSFASRNTTNDFITIKFNITWDNSWRVNTGINNWDAVWIFVKYRKKTELSWRHATLNWVDGTGTNDGHTVPVNGQISSSNDNGANGSYGVFLYSSIEISNSTVSYSNVALRWNYGVDGVYDADSLEVSVIGIEMVYVPQASFYVGSGGTESGAFYTYPTTTNPYLISSESAINVGTTAGYLYYPSPDASGDQTGPIPADFPKGYNAFYSMKYEITQQQYVEFLNMLSRFQQNTRVETNVAAGTTAITNRYVMRNNTTVGNRQAIRCDATIHASNPITFYCDLDADGVANETNDGQNIACNFLSWADVAAYLDWAALRPMTDLEFEKVCRGNQAVVANEFAWGNTTLAQATGISNAGQSDETPSNSEANAVYGNSGGVSGPIRVGSMGQSVNTRTATGAAYYGAFEMSGNVWERIVNVGTPTGRTYTGKHGDGKLDNTGNANVDFWPSTNALGAGLRGGYWWQNNNALRTSNRYNATELRDDRYQDFGGRGVRTAP